MVLKIETILNMQNVRKNCHTIRIKKLKADILRAENECQTGDPRAKYGPPCFILLPVLFKFYCYIRRDRATFVNAILRNLFFREHYFVGTKLKKSETDQSEDFFLGCHYKK